jgi:hypothetical protein
MRKFSILFPLVSFNALTACDGTTDPGPGPATTIAITSGKAPALVAFRDGLAATWQPATMKTPTSFEAAVHGPYVVSVVCEALPREGQSLPETLTWQAARTLDDPHDLAAPCDVPATAHAITGHMVQAGAVQLGSSAKSSDVADWDFALAAPTGSYDLIATTSDGIAVRRGVKIDGDLAVTPPIDVAKDGMALASVVFTTPNATPGEQLSVSVGLVTATNPGSPAAIYQGKIGTAKAAPDAALVSTDTQLVSLQALTGTASRSSRTLQRPFRMTDSTAFTLPAALGGVQWSVTSGQLSASWAALPELDVLRASVRGSSTGTTASSALALEMSPKFLAATGLTTSDLDTDIPSYKPEWKVDVTRPYTRSLTAAATKAGVVSTSEVAEDVSLPGK